MILSEIFEYDETSPSCLRWKVGASSRARVGDPVGSVGGSGYFKTSYRKKMYNVHKLIWEIHNGKCSDGMCVDHKDQNKLNNKISNLRLATNSQNQMNVKAKCYEYNKAANRWRVFISIDKVQTYCGSYLTEAEAKSEALRLKGIHYKEFAPNGKI